MGYNCKDGLDKEKYNEQVYYQVDFDFFSARCYPERGIAAPLSSVCPSVCIKHDMVRTMSYRLGCVEINLFNYAAQGLRYSEPHYGNLVKGISPNYNAHTLTSVRRDLTQLREV